MLATVRLIVAEKHEFGYEIDLNLVMGLGFTSLHRLQTCYRLFIIFLKTNVNKVNGRMKTN